MNAAQRYPEPTVGALIIDPDGRLLLVRSRKWQDRFAVPGGHIELGERMEDALRREVREETGLEVYDIEFLCFQEFIYDEAFWQPRHFVFFDFVCRTHSTAVRLNDEAQEYVWVAPEEALQLALEPYTVVAVREYLRRRGEQVVAAAIAAGQVQIVGLLGLPLGTVCRVEGVFFDGSELRQKAYDGVLLMRVTTVNGGALPRAALLRYSEFQRGVLAGAVPGAPFDVLAYETGGYVGVPAAAWAHVPAVTTTEYFFETSLVVLRRTGDSAGPGSTG